MATISDRKLASLHEKDGSTNLALETDVLSFNSYYAFGLAMPGRSFSSEAYRYGFNGKEKDQDGEFGQTVYDYGFRIYNPSIGRFLSVDPLTDNFPYFSPYQFAGLDPIKYVDLDGLEKAYRVPGSGYIIPASDFHRHTPPPDAEFLHPGPTKEQYEAANEEYKNIGSFVPILDIPIDGYDAINGFREGNYLQGALSGLSLVPGADFITKPLKQILKRADDIKDAVKASGVAKKADFVVTPNGTAVSTDLKKVQKSFDDAGFNKVQDTPKNSVYEVPKADGSGTFNSRLQKGNSPSKTDFDGDRVVNTENTGNLKNKQYVNPDGSSIKGNPSKSERRAKGHIQLEPKK